ncbi:hypothetical protein BJ970_005873 [Saccharopolyspora phatthalungensis]|uniref:Uncharacterized protein n=1 Tax=Saccharopolyspora phatthalungensis TaxID=664693 RepID=A0A840QC04_9PSEU|nr:hypothetical protein [Saccharopolyspora phatthalungensis]
MHRGIGSIRGPWLVSVNGVTEREINNAVGTCRCPVVGLPLRVATQALGLVLADPNGLMCTEKASGRREFAVGGNGTSGQLTS